MKTLFSLLALGAIFYASAQSISGQLVEDPEGAPLGYGSVALYKVIDSTLVAGTISDSTGIFLLDNLDAGRYYLIAQFLGYHAVTLGGMVLAKNESKNLGKLLLKPSDELLREVEVSGERVTTMHKIDRQIYEVEKFQSALGGTATDVLRSMPSVTVDALGNISVRGSTGFVVLLDGKPIQTDAATILNQLPANALQNVEFITAPSARYDPEGKGGLINITTRKGVSDGLFVQGNLKVGLPSIEDYDNAAYAQRYGGDFMLNYRQGDWDFSAGISYLRNDISGRREGEVYTISSDTITRFPSDGERSFDEVNFSGRFTIGYQPSERDQFSLGFYAGERTKDRTADILYYDNHSSLLSTGERLYSFRYFNENLRIRKGDFVLGSFDYAHTFGDNSKISSSLLYEYTLLGGPTTNLNLNPESGEVYQEEYNTNDNPLNGIRFQLDYTWKPFSIGQLESGYQFRNLDHIGDFVYERKNNSTGIFELVPDFSSEVDLRRVIHSAYTQLSGSRGKWTYGVGVRLELMDRDLTLKDKAGDVDTLYSYNFIQPYPSANLQYEVNEGLRLKMAYSRRVERTTTFKMNPFPEREHSETLEQGDPELLPEFINIIELGVIKDFDDHSIFANAYYRNVENLVNRVNTIYNDTILNRIYSNVGRGQALGLELGAELAPFNWWKLFAGGNVYQYIIDGKFDERSINTSSWIYSFTTNMTFDLTKSMSLQWTLNYISAQNTAQGEDSRFLSPNLTLKKSFGNRLSATIQWLNMDMGLLPTNEQRITTFRPGEFYTTTNYVYEVDMIMLNLSYVLNKSNNKSRFIKSEFGEKEF